MIRACNLSWSLRLLITDQQFRTLACRSLRALSLTGLPLTHGIFEACRDACNVYSDEHASTLRGSRLRGWAARNHWVRWVPQDLARPSAIYPMQAEQHVTDVGCRGQASWYNRRRKHFGRQRKWACPTRAAAWACPSLWQTLRSLPRSGQRFRSRTCSPSPVATFVPGSSRFPLMTAARVPRAVYQTQERAHRPILGGRLAVQISTLR